MLYGQSSLLKMDSKTFLLTVMTTSMVLLSGCAGSGVRFSDDANRLEARSAKTVDLKKYKEKSKHIDVRELYVMKSLEKSEIEKLDQDRRHYRELAVKLRDALELKNNSIEQLISIIELLEIENKINSKIAQKALIELDKNETKMMINDAFGKGMSILGVLMLII